MATFRALTSIGLVEPLWAELLSLGLKPVHKGANWVEFHTNWQGCYTANRWLRTASRVILPVLDFKAFSEDELYHQTLRHDFTQYIDVEQTMAVFASVANSNIKDQRIAGLKVKDAVADQFRKRLDARPSVDRVEPHLRIIVRIVHNSVSMAVDTSGRSLSNHGYRLDTGPAPLRENLAAGLLMLAEWTPEQTLVDFMCGSGTFAIEAALMAKGVPAQSMPFSFQKFKKFRDVKFESELAHAPTPVPIKVYASDKDGFVVRQGQQNARRAKVEAQIRFRQCDFREARPPEGASPGIVVINPPYGVRLGSTINLEPLYKDIASHMKSHFKGWDLWILSGDPELTKALRLKSDKKFTVKNGDIECRFLRYRIT